MAERCGDRSSLVQCHLIGHVVIVVIAISAHGRKVAKDLLLDAADLIYFVVPCWGIVLECIAIGFTPLVDFAEKLIVLGAEMTEKLGSEKSLVTLTREVGDRAIDDGRLRWTTVRSKRRKETRKREEFAIQCLSALAFNRIVLVSLFGGIHAFTRLRLGCGLRLSNGDGVVVDLVMN